MRTLYIQWLDAALTKYMYSTATGSNSSHDLHRVQSAVSGSMEYSTSIRFDWVWRLLNIHFYPTHY